MPVSLFTIGLFKIIKEESESPTRHQADHTSPNNTLRDVEETPDSPQLRDGEDEWMKFRLISVINFTRRLQNNGEESMQIDEDKHQSYLGSDDKVQVFSTSQVDHHSGIPVSDLGPNDGDERGATYTAPITPNHPSSLNQYNVEQRLQFQRSLQCDICHKTYKRPARARACYSSHFVVTARKCCSSCGIHDWYVAIACVAGIP